MTRTPTLAFATSISGSHYRDVALIDVTCQARPKVMLATFKVVVMVQVGAKLQLLLMDSLRLCRSVNKNRHASRRVDSP